VRPSATGFDDGPERGEHEDEGEAHEYGTNHYQELPQKADAATPPQEAEPRFQAE
jgi:hypothetical protein